MDYSKIYSALIARGLERGLIKKKLNYYTEKHHIIPKSMGGQNKKDNYVLLTAREHFFAHELLYKIYRNSEMAFALNKFFGGSKEQKISSKEYSWIKKEVTKIQSETTRLMWENLSSEDKATRVAKVGRSVSKVAKNRTVLEKNTVRENILLGRSNWIASLSKDELDKHNFSNNEKRRSTMNSKDSGWWNSYKEKLSSSGKNIPKLQCPYCSIKCDPGNYSKYHGNNCKMRD